MPFSVFGSIMAFTFLKQLFQNVVPANGGRTTRRIGRTSLRKGEPRELEEA
jgi:hypothetical protein